jgi:hypothetical protein
VNANYLRKKRLYELKGRFGLSFGFFQVRRFTFAAAAGGAAAFLSTGSGAAAGDAA